MLVNNQPTLSIVLPCYNEAESIAYAVKELSALLDDMIQQKEISLHSCLYFVDDGSTDETWQILSTLHSKYKIIKGMKLSRNFGHQIALLAGLTEVSKFSDITISIDVDLQQDPKAMHDFIKEYKKGADIVLGIRVDRKTDGWIKRNSASFFYAFMRAMGVKIVNGHADYRLLNKQALQALLSFSEPNIFLRGICSLVGFKCKNVQYKVLERRFGATKYSVQKMFRLALHGITSLSIIPLRMVAVTGFLLFMLSLVMGCYVLYKYLLGNTIAGWASTTLPIYFIGGVQLLCLGIIGEYIGQIYATVKNRPRWFSEDRLG